jgi:hypothetical protein
MGSAVSAAILRLEICQVSQRRRVDSGVASFVDMLIK